MPPDYYSNALEYVSSVLIGTIILAVPPLVFLKFKKPEWARGVNKIEAGER